MNIFIPTVGTTLRLTENWEFILYCEYRNVTMWNTFIDPEIKNKRDMWRKYGYSYREMKTSPVILPAGSILIVDRIYIRKNLKQFDSITFKLKECDVLKIKNKRFWVKLEDANKINCEVIE